MKFLLWYLLLVNAAGLVLMLADKLKAQKNRWRIPERTLLGVAALGGSIGALAGMYLFRHKTRHRQFTWGIPVILVIQIAAGIFIWLRFHA